MSARVASDELLYVVYSELTGGADASAWNEWYDQHTKELTKVPGFNSGERFQQRGVDDRYIATYRIAGMHVFESPEYSDITGWGRWEDAIRHWDRAVYAPVHQWNASE